MWEATGWYYVSWLDLSGFPVADIRKCRAGDWRSSKPTPIILQRVRSATSWGQNAEDRSTFIKSTNCHISDECCDSCKYWLLLMFFTGHWLICIAQTKILANACTKIPLRTNKPSSCFSFQSRTLRKFPNYRLSPVLVACCPVVKFSAHFSGILFILYKKRFSLHKWKKSFKYTRSLGNEELHRNWSTNHFTQIIWAEWF